MRIVGVALAAALWAGQAFAWPYEIYPVPKSLDGYRVADTVALPEGKAELLLDARVTAANTAKVRTVLLGGDAGDEALQHSLDHDDPRWALVRFTPKAGGPAQVVVLDHVLASIAAADIEGDGRPKLKVAVDYLEAYRGVLTLFMEPVAGELMPVEYVDARDGYKVQIELMENRKAWWKAVPAGNATEFLLVDARFDSHTDLMRIRWDGKAWQRTMRQVPAGAVTGPDHFPGREQFP